jgi:hypothetical protein
MRTLAALSMLVGFASIANADVVTIVPSRDNTIFEAPVGNSDGAGPSFFSGRTNTSGVRRGLLFFKVDSSAGIPAGSVVTSVALTLNVMRFFGGSANFSLQRALNNWGEGTSNSGVNGGNGAPATTGDATWNNNFFNTSNWTSPGGDFSTTVSAMTLVNGNVSTGTVPYTWTSAQMAADVQSWLDAPTSNFGWFLIGTEGITGSAAEFASRQNSTFGVRPMLEVTFTQVPEPVSLMLVGVAAIGGLAVRRRQRR